MLKKISFFLIFLFIFSLTIKSTIAAEIGTDLKKLLNKKNNTKFKIILLFKGFDYETRTIDAKEVVKNLQNHSKKEQAEFKKLLNSKAVKVKRVKDLWIINAIAMIADKNTILKFSQRNDIKKIILDKEIFLEEPKVKSENIQSKGKTLWCLDLMEVPRVWAEYGFKGEGIVIGHIDTGMDRNHPDLKGKILMFRDFTKDGAEVPAYDDQGHGSHTAGTILGGNASGKAIGVAPNAKIICAKVFKGSGGTESSWLLNSMQWMMDPDGNPDTNDAPPLVSNSWGSSAVTNDTFWDAVKAWVTAGIFPAFSAGNSGPRPNTAGTPGNFPHSFSIGATDINDKIASFSSRGPSKWNGKELIRPDVSAPGKDVYSVKTGGGWCNKSGTSMACPNVAGVIALMLQAKPDLSIEQIKTLLEKNAKELGAPGKDNDYGSGRINAYKTIQILLSGGDLKGTLTDSTGNPVNGKILIAENQLNISVESGQFAVTLAEGTYNITIKAFGYEDITDTITIVKEKVTTKNYVANKLPHVTLTGKILSEMDNTPLKAIITFKDTPLESVKTDEANGKFKANIPVGIYTLKIQSVGYKPKEIEVYVNNVTEPVEIKLAHLPPILLVDDAKKASNLADYYKIPLNEGGFEYTYHNTVIQGSPDFETLFNYPVVIWFTGLASSNTLTEVDRKNITKYLKTGGNLLVSGQDIGYELKYKDNFLKDTLHAKFEKDSATDKINLYGKDLFNGVALKLKGEDSASNQKYPDVLTAIDANIAFEYSNNQIAGVIYENEIHKLIYCGFGLEGIDGKENRKDILAKSINFLMPTTSEKISKFLAIKKQDIKYFYSRNFNYNNYLKKLKIAEKYLNNLESQILNDLSINKTDSFENLVLKLKSLNSRDKKFFIPLIRNLYSKIIFKNSLKNKIEIEELKYLLK